MKKTELTKAIGLVSFAIIAITFILASINSIISFVDIAKMSESTLKTFKNGMQVIELVSSIVIVAFAVLGFISTFKGKDALKSLYFSAVTIFTLGLAEHVVSGATISYAKSLTTMYEPAAKELAVTILFMLSFATIIVGIIFRNIPVMARKGIFAIGYIFAVAAIIVTIATGNLKTFPLIVEIFTMISVISATTFLFAQKVD